MKVFRLAAVLGFTLLFALSPLRGVAQTPSYLPLQQGSQWELRSSAVGQSMVFLVEAASGSAYRVKWQNPWVKADFFFEPKGNQVLLQGLDMGNGLAPMPGGTVYFDFGASAGTRWSNSLGKLAVVAKGLTVKTPAGVFSNCIEISATDKAGAKTFWFFAPGVGFVQFGEGSAAFFLTSYKKTGGTNPSVAVTPDKGTSPAPGKRPERQGGLYIGLESNPTPAQGYSFEAKRASFEMSSQAGSRLVFVHPVWSEVEAKAGSYNFSDVDDRVKLAEMYGAAVLLNIRIIDTNKRAVPSDYAGWSWNDPRMQQKLTAFIVALVPHLKGRCRWVTIGNEVDSYFANHKNEIESYAQLFGALSPTLHQSFPGAPLTVNFTAGAIGDLKGKYKSITDKTEIYSLNFYPINADFTFRDPATSGRELQQMILSASDRPIVFQEMGYPSSAKLGSSEDKQAMFLDSVLHVLAQNQSRVQAVNFNWRSDLPDSVVKDLTSYYKLGNSGNFREFLASLGWFQVNGTPKKIWSVFQKEVPAFSR